MKKAISVLVVVIGIGVMVLTGCGRQESTSQAKTGSSAEKAVVKEVKAAVPAPKPVAVQKVQVAEGDPSVYLSVEEAKASSFDQTPDWAPEPNPMAPADGDMLTRWSSDYVEGDQWIYFDLGKESVVSEIIIRWERAYATAYEILVSNDAQNWDQVFEVTNAPSGAVESAFTPVKCRYVKILGTERVNEDWGISMWECEIYGPQSQNPEATMTKEAYLNKGDDEGKKKEAGELLNKLAAAAVPISEKPFQKGVVYTSWMDDEFLLPASDLMLGYIKELGYDTVSIMVPAYQDDLDSTVIFTNDKPGGDTPTDEALKHVVESCHKIGLRVMIKPHVDPRTDEARINIMPSEEWFDSYEKFAVRYAKFAEENKAEMYSVGTELEATTFSAWAARWNQVIEKIKEVYTGTLTYSANWTEYKEVPFWDKMDFIGLDAYFPLAEKDNPTMEELTTAWNAKADEIEKWLAEKGLNDKGVILTEIGYPSAEGASRQPWVAISNVEDQQEQADCFKAMFDVLTKRPWFKGYYVWQYFPQDRWSPLGFTVKGKKAEEIIKEQLKPTEEM